MPLGAGSWYSAKSSRCRYGQLDGVGDGLDLRVEAADVGVGDVGHLLEDQLLDLGPGQLLDEQPRPRVHQHGVAGPQLDARAGPRRSRPPAPRRPGRRSRARRPSSSMLLQGDDLAASARRSRTSDDVERLVEHHLVAPCGAAPGRCRGAGHPHLAAAREDVDRAVVVDAEERAVGRRRLGELLDLLAQRGQLLLGLLEGEGQLLVLRDRLGQLALGLEQPLLEGLDPAGALLEPPAQGVDLLLGLDEPGAQRLELGRGLSIGRSRRTHLPWVDRARPYRPAGCGRATRRPPSHAPVGTAPTAVTMGTAVRRPD